MKRLTSLPVWQQDVLGAAYLLPWTAVGIFATDILPEAWRFQAWPGSLRVLSLVLLALVVVADALFGFWYVFL